MAKGLSKAKLSLLYISSKCHVAVCAYDQLTASGQTLQFDHSRWIKLTFELQ